MTCLYKLIWLATLIETRGSLLSSYSVHSAPSRHSQKHPTASVDVHIEQGEGQNCPGKRLPDIFPVCIWACAQFSPMLCILRCFSEWLKSVWMLSSDPSHQQGISVHTLLRENSKPRYSYQPIWHKPPCRGLGDSIFPPFWFDLIWLIWLVI